MVLKRILKGANIPVPQNWSLIDRWSIMHLLSGIFLCWLLGPIGAFILMALYEPFEVYVLSPFLYYRFKIVFGNEGLTNSLSDIVFNTIGIAIGMFLR